MRTLVPAVIFVFILTVSVNAQIQKSTHNRVFVDEDYEYTERLRLNRTINELLAKGLNLYKAGDYRAAETAFSTAVQLDPSVFSAQHNLGVVHVHLEDYEAAVNDFRNALALDERSASAWHFLGFTYFHLKNPQEATRCYLRAAELNPQSSVTWNNLGQTYLTLDKLDSATDALNKALAIDPSSIEAINGLCFAYVRLKQSEQALSFCGKSRAAKSSFVKKPKDAKRVFERALAIAPDFVSARYNLAMTCLALKQKDCAREQYAILKTVDSGLSTQLLDQIYSSKVVRLLR